VATEAAKELKKLTRLRMTRAKHQALFDYFAANAKRNTKLSAQIDAAGREILDIIGVNQDHFLGAPPKALPVRAAGEGRKRRDRKVRAADIQPKEGEIKLTASRDAWQKLLDTIDSDAQEAITAGLARYRTNRSQGLAIIFPQEMGQLVSEALGPQLADEDDAEAADAAEAEELTPDTPAEEEAEEADDEEEETDDEDDWDEDDE